MDQATYERETAMCRELHEKQRGCHWGRCETCGVIPLLHKQRTGEALEDEEAIAQLKRDIFQGEI